MLQIHTHAIVFKDYNGKSLLTYYTTRYELDKQTYELLQICRERDLYGFVCVFLLEEGQLGELIQVYVV
jgi:hypothetical protein